MPVTMKWNGDIIKLQGKKVVNKSAYETGLIIEGQAKELCARKYGYLAASINTQSIDNGTDIESPSKYAKETPPAGHKVGTFRKIIKPSDSKTTFVGTAVDYGPFIEWGTMEMPAQPFMRPSLDLAKGKSLSVLNKNGKYYFADYIKWRVAKP